MSADDTKAWEATHIFNGSGCGTATIVVSVMVGCGRCRGQLDICMKSPETNTEICPCPRDNINLFSWAGAISVIRKLLACIIHVVHIALS